MATQNFDYQKAITETNRLLGGQYFDSTGKQTKQFTPQDAQANAANYNIPASTLKAGQTPIKFPTLQDTPDYRGALTSVSAGAIQPEQEQDDMQSLLKGYVDAFPEPTNPLEGRRALEQEIGIDQKTQEVSRLSNEINAINADVRLAQEELRGAGISKTEELLKGNKITRDAAFRTYPLAIQLDAAQGNLSAAEAKLNTYFQIQTQYERDKLDLQQKKIDAVFQFATDREKEKLQDRRLQDERTYDEKQNNLKYSRDLAETAIINRQGDLATEIMSLDINSPTYQEDIARLAGKIQQYEDPLDRQIKQAQLAKAQKGLQEDEILPKDEFRKLAEAELKQSLTSDYLDELYEEYLQETQGEEFTSTELKKLEQAELSNASRKEQLDYLFEKSDGGFDFEDF